MMISKGHGETRCFCLIQLKLSRLAWSGTQYYKRGTEQGIPAENTVFLSYFNVAGKFFFRFLAPFWNLGDFLRLSNRAQDPILGHLLRHLSRLSQLLSQVNRTLIKSLKSASEKSEG
jgi:hypothetical protein